VTALLVAVAAVWLFAMYLQSRESPEETQPLLPTAAPTLAPSTPEPEPTVESTPSLEPEAEQQAPCLDLPGIRGDCPAPRSTVPPRSADDD
jgi:hypothetical protein